MGRVAKILELDVTSRKPIQIQQQITSSIVSANKFPPDKERLELVVKLERVSDNTSDKSVSFSQWRTLIRVWLLDRLIAHLRHLENEIAKTRH